MYLNETFIPDSKSGWYDVPDLLYVKILLTTHILDPIKIRNFFISSFLLNNLLFFSEKSNNTEISYIKMFVLNGKIILTISIPFTKLPFLTITENNFCCTEILAFGKLFGLGV